jgi:hypothetical protein
MITWLNKSGKSTRIPCAGLFFLHAIHHVEKEADVFFRQHPSSQ